MVPTPPVWRSSQEPVNSTDNAEPAPRRQPLPTSRRIALAIYGVALLFVIVAGFRSVIPQIFWPEDELAVAAPSNCGDEVRELERVLLDRSASHVRSGGRPQSTTPPSWLPAWDARFHALERACPEQSITSLERLRFRIERTLWRFDHNEAVRVAELPEFAVDATP